MTLDELEQLAIDSPKKYASLMLGIPSHRMRSVTILNHRNESLIQNAQYWFRRKDNGQLIMVWGDLVSESLPADGNAEIVE